MKLGVLPLARATFDVAFSQERYAAMQRQINGLDAEIVGPRELLFEAAQADAALDTMHATGVDALLILQVTFTDAATTLAAAERLGVPVSIWAVPEPRLGGRLRLNAFCGLNLAGHALGRANVPFGWLYEDPDRVGLETLKDVVSGRRVSPRLQAEKSRGEEGARGAQIAAELQGKRIARLGAHPEGFDTCRYSADGLKKLAGIEVEAFDLNMLFDTAKATDDSTVDALRAEAENDLSDLDAVNEDELDRSLRLRAALENLRSNDKFDAFAVRCWPETFTEYGGAVCGPAAMMGERRVPCACEADVVGAVTQLILMEAADAPVFLTDLVDMDVEDDTGVVWHCGQAPISMQDPDVAARATIHTNRKMPLLYEFPLKAGPVTFMRISQAFNTVSMIIGFGEMLKRPMAFTGTSGVVRFEGGTTAALDRIMASGLEHHMALAYGDHREVLREVAGALDLPVLELTA